MELWIAGKFLFDVFPENVFFTEILVTITILNLGIFIQYYDGIATITKLKK